MEKPVPDLPETRPLEKADKPFFDELFRGLNPQISEYTFTNLFAWRKKTSLEIACFQDSFILITGNSILPPINYKRDISYFKELSILFKEEGIAEKGIRFPKDTADILKPLFRVEEDRDNWDYVYRTNDLIHLPGRHLDGKRNLIKKFEQRYPHYRYREIDAEIVESCLMLQEEWCNLKQCSIDEGLSGEDAAIHELFKDYHFFDLFGGAICLDGKVIAFAVGEELNHNTAVVHFEKADSAYLGIYQLINREFASRTLAGYEFINREQDIGKEGIRKAKLSYHPHHFEEKFTVYF
jgi:hypothetical protein